MSIKPREKRAVLQSLGAGVVPKIGLHLIQVGRKKELEAFISDLMAIEDGGAAIRFVIGPFGSGKTFFLNLVRTVALKRRFVVMQADITLDRRLYSTGGHARALYTELIQNMCTKAKPEGGAMPGLVERYVSDVHREAGATSDGAILEKEIAKRLQPLLDLTHGTNFVRVLARYVEGFASHNDDLTNAAMRWLRGEYTTKTEARQDLGVRNIIEDSHLYDILKLWTEFVRITGHRGLFVNIDEMVVLSERLNNSATREKNYEVILQILNACLQGRVGSLGLCFAGTELFLSDRRRGLYSYEALATRLADNPFATPGMIDLHNPVVRLQSLSREDLYVLLERIARVHAGDKEAKPLVDYDGTVKFMAYCERRLGAQHFLTPRDTVKLFVGLLNALEQNPGSNLESLLQIEESASPSLPEPPDGEALTKFRL